MPPPRDFNTRFNLSRVTVSSSQYIAQRVFVGDAYAPNNASMLPASLARNLRGPRARCPQHVLPACMQDFRVVGAGSAKHEFPEQVFVARGVQVQPRLHTYMCVVAKQVCCSMFHAPTGCPVATESFLPHKVFHINHHLNLLYIDWLHLN